MKKMTKFKKGEKHKCDDTCKVNHTTDFARENKLPTGSKIHSTLESSVKAYEAQVKRVAETEEFKNKQKVILRKEKIDLEKEHGEQVRQNINLRKEKIEDKIAIPLAELVELSENSTHVGEIAMEIEKALIRIKRLEKDLSK